MKAARLDPALSRLIDGHGERLKAARIAAGFSQSKFADAIGVDPPRLANWEKGTHPPPAHFLALMKQRYGIGADWILSGDAGALSGRLMQAMINLGSAPDAPLAAREFRRVLPDLPDPDRPADPYRLHDEQALLLGKFVRTASDSG